MWQLQPASAGRNLDAVCVRSGRLRDMNRIMTILSIVGVAAALYFAWRYGVF